MTCSGCSAKVEKILSAIPGVTKSIVNLESNSAEITMDKHISTSVFHEALTGTKYSIEEKHHAPAVGSSVEMDEPVTLKTYLPIFLIFGYITAVTLLIQVHSGRFNITQWMAHFMAGFFLTFSFFKLLDVSGFASSYSSYDIVAKRIYAYGYVYPFIELALGISFLIPTFHWWSNLITFIVMTVSIIGVIQSMLRKSPFQCACLGAIFKLPLSKITLFEDALMIVMSGASLLYWM